MQVYTHTHANGMRVVVSYHRQCDHYKIAATICVNVIQSNCRTLEKPMYVDDEENEPSQVWK